METKRQIVTLPRLLSLLVWADKGCLMDTNGRYPHLTEFLKHFRVRMGAAKNTLEAYEDDIKQFFNWILTAHGYNDVTKVTRKHIYEFRDYLEQQGYAIATLQRRFAALSQFVGYLIQSEIIKEENDPWPRRLCIRGEKPLPHFVPTPHEIFRLRMKANVRLEWAWFFELALSSGMRTDELMQLRACDFNFDERPFDKELGRPSPYFVGSIQLVLTRMTLKNDKPRRVYFSYIAGMLIKEFLCKHGMTLKDNTPIFPWVRQNAQDWMRTLGNGVINRNHTHAVGTGLMQDEIQRDRYFNDLDINELLVDKKFKGLVKRRQEEGAGLEQYKKEAARPVKARRRNLHPHSLRHAFTSFTYYRNPLGERQAEVSLRLLLGHKSDDALFSYLRNLPLVDNDSTWKQLWLGKPHDWSGITR